MLSLEYKSSLHRSISNERKIHFAFLLFCENSDFISSKSSSVVNSSLVENMHCKNTSLYQSYLMIIGWISLDYGRLDL